MKMRHCFAIIVLSVGLAQPGFSQQTPDASTEVLVPLAETTDGQGHFQISTTPSPEALEQDKDELSYLAKLRRSLDELAYQESLHGQGDGLAHAAKSSAQRFTKESATFFVAIFAIELQSLMIEYSDNPSALSKHLASLTDPIANMSFYLFMVANGYSVNFLQKGVQNLDPANKARAMKRISYLGMAAGAITSGLGGELVSTLKDCSQKMFNHKMDKDQTLAANSSCAAALHAWTPSKKAQEYIPQIISLLASSEIAQFADIRGKQAIMWAPKKIAAYLAANKSQVFKFFTVQVVTTAAPGGFVIKSVALVGKLTQFAAFTYADRKISPYIQKFFGNAFKSFEFSFDAKSFNEAIVKSKEANWLDQPMNQSVARDLGFITERMKAWRQQQLGKFYSAHSVWGENTLRVIEQGATTYSFYKSYMDSLFSTLKAGEAIRTGRLPPATMVNESYYPFRTLPLYGVKITEELPVGYSSVQDLYLQSPAELESYQLQTVRTVNEGIKIMLQNKNLPAKDRAFLVEISSAFSGNDLNAIGVAINKINQVVDNQRYVFSAELKAEILKLRSALGNPTPILTPGLGFSYAYEYNTFNNLGLQKLDRPKGSGSTSRRTTDYFWIQMACGADDKFYSNPWGMTPSFMPPKILNKNVRVPDLCQPVGTPQLDANGRELSNIYSQSFVAEDGHKYNGINELIYKNIRPEILGDFRKADGISNFDVWWKNNVQKDTESLFRIFDQDYVHVLSNMVSNWDDSAPSLLDQVNQSAYLDRDALENLNFEMNIYATVLNEILAGRVAGREVMLPAQKRIYPQKGVGIKMIQGDYRPALEDLSKFRIQDDVGFLGRVKAAVDARVHVIQAHQNREVPIIVGSYQQIAASLKLDATILKGQPLATLQEIVDLVEATQLRLDVLRNFKVIEDPNTHQMTLVNFPDKQVSLDALKATRESLKSLSKVIASVQGLSPSQIEIVAKATEGLDSVVGEVSALTMAMYTTKYKLSDDYQAILDQRKDADKDKPAAPKKAGFNPRGG